MKLLMIGIKKDKDLIARVSKFLNLNGGIAWNLIKRYKNGKAKIRWFTPSDNFITTI